MSQLDLAAIKNILPHRPPILLVDEVVTWTPSESLHGRRTFAEDDPAFEGHFPGFPVLPGVLGIEALAQSAALLTNLTEGLTAEETLFFFMGIKDAKFQRPIVPGETLDLHVTLEKTKRSIYWYKGVARVNGDICTEASFVAKLALKKD